MSGTFDYDPNIGSRDAYDEVYTGFWINQLHGRVNGATLTLNRQKGAFLIAFLALFVGTAGKSFWRIVRYWLHHVYSSTKTPDGVYHQRQAILCNTPSALDAALGFVNVGWAWRKRATKLAVRTLPSLTLAIVVSAGFTVAGIFSSRVTFNNANEVLLSGVNCGIASTNGTEARGNTTDMNAAIYPYLGIKLTEYLTYALQCYQKEDPDRSEKCQIFFRPTLPYTVESNAPCPFAEEMCLFRDKNIKLDTGFLDSEKDLGINGGQHFFYRAVRHCAPLVTEGHTVSSPENTTDGARTLGYQYSRIYDAENAGVTYNASVFPINGSVDAIEQWMQTRTRDYKIKVMQARAQAVVKSNFSPTLQLKRSDAAVALLFLSAPGIIYESEISDPWFSASTPISDEVFTAITGSSARSNFFISEQPATVLGCTSQRYYCNPDLPEDKQCMNIDQEGENSYDVIPRLWPDPVQKAKFYGAMTSMRGLLTVEPHDFLSFPGLPGLMARFSLNSGKQANIDAEKQWQKEMEYTFQAYLASLQSSLVEAVKGAFPLRNDTLCDPPEACKTICKNQKIRSPRHYSFSVLGLAIILAVGGTIMLIGTFIESIVSYYSNLRHRKRGASYAQLEWQTNSILQLQRLAHEGIGAGTWSKASGIVPVTGERDEIGILDITDQKHARLVRPGGWLGLQGSGEERKGSQYSSRDQNIALNRSVSPEPSLHSREAVGSRYSAVSSVSDDDLYLEHDRYPERAQSRPGH